MTAIAPNLDGLCVNTIRGLCMDATERASSGHPGTPLGMGLDTAATPLALACSRGVRVVREHLPFRAGVLGAVLVVVTVCFAEDPAALLAEARRVIRPDGAVVLGEVFAESPWGRFYQHQGARSHPAGPGR
jgi:SAM-dependent methyltransferase